MSWDGKWNDGKDKEKKGHKVKRMELNKREIVKILNRYTELVLVKENGRKGGRRETHEKLAKRMKKTRQTSVLVKSIGELIQGRGDTDALHQHTSLTLDLDVLGPTNEPSEIASGRDSIANPEVTGTSIKERQVSVFLDLLGRSKFALTCGFGFGASFGGVGFLGRHGEERRERGEKKKERKRGRLGQTKMPHTV